MKLKTCIISACLLLAPSAFAQNKAGDMEPDGIQDVSVQGDTIIVSPRVSTVISEWHGDLEENLTFSEYLLEEAGKAHVVNEYLDYVRRQSQDYTPVDEYLANANPLAAQQWEKELEDPDDYQFENSEAGLALYLLTQKEDVFYAWQSTAINKEIRDFYTFAEESYPQDHSAWQSTLYIPANVMTLDAWAAKGGDEDLVYWIQVLICLLNGGTLEDCLEDPTGSGGTGGEGDCNCRLIMTPNHITSNYVSASGKPEDSKKKKKHWWTEQFYGAHYAEAYVYGKGKDMHLGKGELEQDNQTAFRIRMECLDDGRPCEGCHADLDIYSLYGTKVQVHTDTWGLFGGKSEASSKDHAILDIFGNNGDFVAFDKMIAITQTSEKKFKLDKLIAFAKDLVDIGSQIVSGTGSTSSYAKLADKAVKNFKGIIEKKGKQGTTSDYMYVEYDSIGNPADPEIVIKPNQDYAITLKSNGQIVYQGSGRNKTNNSYYGSSAALAFGVNHFFCEAGAKPPKPSGCWAHSNAYRSPYKGTTTLQDNIKWFMQSALSSSSAPNTNANNACWTP